MEKLKPVRLQEKKNGKMFTFLVFPDGKIKVPANSRALSADFSEDDFIDAHIGKTGSGYMRISRHNVTFYVHRLVAEAFVHNPDPTHFLEVNHKDENQENNRYDNLEWCDRQYNVTYGTRIQRVSDNNKKKDKPAAKFLLSLGKMIPELTKEEKLAYKRIEYFNRKYGIDIFSDGRYKDTAFIDNFRKDRQSNAKSAVKPCRDYLISLGKHSRSDLSNDERRVYNRIYEEFKNYGIDIFANGDYLLSDEAVQEKKALRISQNKKAFYASRE